jgi:hypothetical protein
MVTARNFAFRGKRPQLDGEGSEGREEGECVQGNVE